jgi:hypothetical protein
MRVLVIVAAGFSLAGCSSMSSMDIFKTTPPEVTLQLDSVPPGADAVTSVGPGCKTPCEVKVATNESFTVTYTLPKYQPQTLQVTVVSQPGEVVLDPNPAVAELALAAPAKPAKRKRHVARAAKPAPAAPAAAPAPAPDASPFPPVR